MARKTKNHDNTNSKVDISDNNYTEQSSAEVETIGPETKNGIISNAISVRVRKEPNLESDIIDVLSGGSKVTIISEINDFYKVLFDNKKEGYVYSELIKEV